MAALQCLSNIKRLSSNVKLQKFSQHFGYINKHSLSTNTETAHKTKTGEFKHYTEIPGPKIWPVIGNLPDIILDKDMDKTKLYVFWSKMVDKYGPIIRLHLPGEPNLVFVKRPEDIETMYRVTMHNPVRPGFDSVKKVRDNAPGDFFSKKTGILSEQGDEWWRVRSKVQTHMLKPRSIISYLGQHDQITREFLDRIPQLRDSNNEVPDNFITELYKWALESVAVIALGRRFGCLQANLSEDSMQMKVIKEVNILFETLNTTEMGLKFWKLFNTPTFRRLTTSHDTLVKLAVETIKQTEEEIKSKSLDMDRQLTLMETMLSTPGLSKADVVTIILDMLFAGVDTTSHTIAFNLYCLSRNPDKQKKLQEEIDAVLPNRDEPITSKHLGQLSYLKAVVKESFRLFPLIMGTARTLDQDSVFSGYLVPKGFQIIALVQLAGWDEEYFKQADKYIPERWLRHQPMGPINYYASLPFSTGTRMCIGRRIAEQEIYVMLARIFQRYTVDYKYEDMYPISKLVFCPSHPLKFNFIDRH